jgi:archaellin
VATFQTYIDLEFIDRFTRECPERSPLVRSEKEQFWDSVVEYLRGQTDVIIDAPENVIEKVVQENPLVALLLDRPEGTECRLSKDAIRQAETREENAGTPSGQPWQLFLLQSIGGHPGVLSEKNRLLYLNFEELEYHWPHLHQRRSLNVSVDEKASDVVSWNCLQKARVPHVTSGIIICDRYMLQSKNSRQNVVDLLAMLLVENGGSQRNLVPVSILLVAEKENVRGDVEQHRRSLQQSLARKRPNVDFKLSVAAANLKAYHDRHIFTNYAFITSGHSLDYFKYEGDRVSHVLKNTLLDISSKLDRDVLQTAAKKLRELGAILKSAREGKTRVAGDTHHPLIETAMAQGHG